MKDLPPVVEQLTSILADTPIKPILDKVSDAGDLGTKNSAVLAAGVGAGIGALSGLPQGKLLNHTLVGAGLGLAVGLLFQHADNSNTEAQEK